MYRPNGKSEKPYVISKVQSATAIYREPIKIAAPSAESSDDELNDDDLGLTPSLIDAVPIIDGTPPVTPTKRKAQVRKRSPPVTLADDDYELPSDDDEDDEDDEEDGASDDDEADEDDTQIEDLALFATPMAATTAKKRGNRSAKSSGKQKKKSKTTKNAKP